MKWLMMIAAVLMVGGVAGAAEIPAQSTIRLQLLNAAKVPDDVLEKSRQQVARIFEQAGVEVVWTAEAPRLTVIIIPRVLGFDRATSPVMGAALKTTSGLLVQVFFQQVEGFARSHHVDLSTILGHVIAHEVGHLMLPTESHSPTGLMRAEWDSAQMRDVVRGAVTFTDEQAESIRARH